MYQYRLSLVKKILRFLSHNFTVGVSESDVPYIRIRACTKHVLILQDADHRLGHMYVNIGAAEIAEQLKMSPVELRDWLTSNGARKLKRAKRVATAPLYD